MSDNFKNHTSRLSSPGTKGEVADYYEQDYTFSFVPRYIKCSDSGILLVDLVDSVEIELPVTPGVNPERVVKIYSVDSGSDEMTVTGLA
jgi:hypothetical protein